MILLLTIRYLFVLVISCIIFTVQVFNFVSLPFYISTKYALYSYTTVKFSFVAMLCKLYILLDNWKAHNTKIV